jgi:hypothetical protein
MSKYSSSSSRGLFEDVVESGEGEEEMTLREREGCRPRSVGSTTNLLPLACFCDDGPGLCDECEAAGVAERVGGSTPELTSGRP